MTHKTKAVVLRTVKYGESSLIVTMFTALFGLQSYIVKGIRSGSKSAAGKISFFQPAALLELEAYQNPVKHLQFIKEYHWAYIYKSLYFDVLKNAVATYLIEMVVQTIKEEESGSSLYDIIETSLAYIDQHEPGDILNIPLIFSIQLASLLGFRFQGHYTAETPVLDLQEGRYVAHQPQHGFYLDGQVALMNSQLMQIKDLDQAKEIQISNINRRSLLKYYQQFFSLHLENYREARSYQILRTVLQ
jgi:DNA repair protein RecO (recombination protein O)